MSSQSEDLENAPKPRSCCKPKKRNHWIWKVTVSVLMATGIFVSILSNRLLYLSHQRFPLLTWVQLKYASTGVVKAAEPKIIGHRGSGTHSTKDGQLIGNTLHSIKAAIAAEVEWLEIDIRMTSDDRLVVFHDESVVDKTDFDMHQSKWPDCTDKVQDLSLFQLETLKLHLSDGQTILSLDKLFRELGPSATKVRWIFDLKAEGMEPVLKEWLQRNPIQQDHLILFGDRPILEDYKDWEYRLGYTVLFRENWQTMWFNPSLIFQQCKELPRPNNDRRLMVVPIIFLTVALVQKAKAEDIEVWCYDSNHQADLKYAVGCGVEGLIVDHPNDIPAFFGGTQDSP